MSDERAPSRHTAHVLGPLGVRAAGEPCDLGGPKPRLLLALLLANLGRAVSTDSLSEALWGDDQPPTARKALQVHVSNLRRALGDDFPLRTAPGGYLIDRDGLELDAATFEALMTRGASALASDPAEARERLASALALWTGSPYADLEGEAALESEVARLNELRLQALTLRIDADLRLGRHSEVVAELDTLTRDHPYRERLHALHMLALYRAGRQAEALRAYQRTRRVLADELGIEPGPELQTLERQILDQSRELDVDEPPAEHRYAFLATDLEGSTPLWEAEPDAMETALARHDSILEDEVARHGGKVFQTTGDGLYAVFARASDAIGAAVDAQRALHEEPWPTSRPLAVRMAVDEGRATPRDGDYFGPVMNRVSRIMASAHGRQVVIPASLCEVSPVPVTVLGTADYKGIGRVEVAQLLIDGLPHEFPELRTDRAPAAARRQAFTQALRGYELRERLGEGSQGVVYRAYQASVGREVAVKVIRPEFANRPDFVKRFEAEAQYVAQLEHPHIVPLYDYWRDPDGAYLAMQWLRGGSLAAALERAPWRPPAALHLVGQIGTALSYAHRHGVVHRDLKPANVLLDTEGNAFLSDFGIAAEPADESASPVTSSIAYVAPEALAGGPVGVAADVYGLALLTYEVLTGDRPPLGAQPQPVAARHRELPAELDDVLARATHPDPAARFPRVDDFLRALRQAFGADVVTRSSSDALEVRNPYKGLRAFAETDAADFFGRDAVVDVLLRTVSESPITTVVGPSGSGKSSLVKAGLLPAIRRGGLGAELDVLITEMFPGSFPFEELEAALLRVAVERPDGLADELASDDRGLLRASKQILPDDDSVLLLVVDQFEELFSLTTAEDVRRRFLANLVTVGRDVRGRVRVVLTIRADFFDRPLEYPEFGELVTQGLVTVARPGTDELALAISAPARNAGLELEPGLVSTITRDVADEPGALPLLQYALTEMVNQRDGSLLTIAGYERTGGVLGALATRAEEIYAGLPEGAQDAAREVFLRLVAVDADTDDTRRRVRRTELESLGLSDAALDTVLGEYGSFRLLAFDRDPVTRGPTVEVAHEALIREWPRYRQWVDAKREDLLLERRLDAAATEWDGSGREPSFLFTGGRLDHYERWAAAGGVRLTELERAFLTDARSHADDADRRAARRRRRVLAAMTALAVVASSLAALAFAQRDRANEKADLAESLRSDAEQRAAIETARSLAIASTATVDDDPQLAMLLAVEAFETASAVGAELPDVMEALYESTRRDRVVLRTQTHARMASLGRGLSLSPDGTRAVLLDPARGDEFPGTHTAAVIVDLETGDPVQRLEEPDGVSDVWWDATAGLVVTGTDGALSWWDPESGERARTLRVGDGSAWGISGTPNLLGFSLVEDLDRGVSVAVVAERASGQRVLEVPNAIRTSIAPNEDAAVTLTLGGELLVHALPGGEQLAAVPSRPRATPDLAFIPGEDAFWWVVEGELRRVALATGEVSVNEAIALEIPRSAPQFSPDGRRLAVGYADGRIAILDATTLQAELELKGHHAPIGWIEWTRDGLALVSSDHSGEVRVWDLTEARRYVDIDVASPDEVDLVLYARFDSPVLLEATRRLGLDLELDENAGPARRIAVDEGRGALAVSTGSAIGVYDRRGSLDARVDAGFNEPLEFSTQGSLLAAGVGNRQIGTPEFPRAAFGVVDLATGEPAFREVGSYAGAAAFAPDGERVLFAIRADATAVLDRTDTTVLVAYATDTGEELARLDTGRCINRLAYSEDGRRFATGGCTGDVVVYDHERFVAGSADAELGRAAVSGSDAVFGVTLAPDGSEVYAGGLDNRLTAWSVDDGMRQLWSLDRGEPVGRLVLRDGHLWVGNTAGLFVGADRTWFGLVAIPFEQRQLADFARGKLVRDFTEAECLEHLGVRCEERAA